MALHEMGKKAEPALRDVFAKSSDPRQRARAFWLLTRLPEAGPGYILQALEDKNERIRATAVRAARQIDRTSVVWGKSVSVRVDLGGRRIIKKKKKKKTTVT